MNETDKAKLKVLVKMILIQKSPKWMTANQISSIINEHNWGFHTDISPSKVSKLISMELSKRNKNRFMENVNMGKGKNKINVYQYIK